VGGFPVLLLHPHPLHGGTKGTRLIYQLAKALAAAGFRVVRFDFRGAGDSDGEYGAGAGELEDAARALAWLSGESGQTPAVVGFSFGGAVAVALAHGNPVSKLVLIAAPATVRDSNMRPIEFADDVVVPAHFIVGANDDVVPPHEALRLAIALGASTTIIPEGDHFLSPVFHDLVIADVLASLQDLL
jgi:alpha/beta superfamily hydrolase